MHYNCHSYENKHCISKEKKLSNPNSLPEPPPPNNLWSDPNHFLKYISYLFYIFHYFILYISHRLVHVLVVQEVTQKATHWIIILQSKNASSETAKAHQELKKHQPKVITFTLKMDMISQLLNILMVENIDMV